jgi:hypothetical protein
MIDAQCTFFLFLPDLTGPPLALLLHVNDQIVSSKGVFQCLVADHATTGRHQLFQLILVPNSRGAKFYRRTIGSAAKD